MIDSFNKKKFNRNEDEMDKSLENSSDSLDNSSKSSLESLSDVNKCKQIWTPEFFKDRIEFANSVIITQIKDKNTIITFKESRKGFLGFPKN